MSGNGGKTKQNKIKTDTHYKILFSMYAHTSKRTILPPVHGRRIICKCYAILFSIKEYQLCALYTACTYSGEILKVEISSSMQFCSTPVVADVNETLTNAMCRIF